MSARSKRITVMVAVFVMVAGQAVGDPPGGNPRSTTAAGFIDPTAATFNSNRPLVHCTGSCSTALINQNTDALQKAMDLANVAPHPWVLLPPGEYPVFRGGASHNQHYAIHLPGYQHIVIKGYGATLRSTGDLANSDQWILGLETGAAHVRVIGVTFSQRDVTNAPEQTHMLEIGDGVGAIDDVQVIDCVFEEGVGGDAIRLLGGITQDKLLTHVVINANTIDSKRSGVAVQHGVLGVNITGNWFGPNDTDQMIDFEPTGQGGQNHFNITNNLFNRPVATGSFLIALSGFADLAYTANWNVFAYNIVPNGSMGGVEVRHSWIVGNYLSTDDVQNNEVIGYQNIVEDTWIVDNFIRQRSSAAFAAQGIKITGRAGDAPQNAWIRGNRVEVWLPGITTTANAVGITTQAVGQQWITENTISYHAALGDSGANGFIAVGASSEGGPVSGWFENNVIVRGLQADGVTLAGRPFCGIDVSVGTSTKQIGHAVIRDNLVDGAKETFFMDQTPGPSSMIDGLMIITGNTGLNVTTDNLPFAYRVDSTSLVETLTGSGALSPSRPATILNSACSPSLNSMTLADGVVDGETKDLKIFAACVATGTLTPTHFGDGTSLSWASSATVPGSVMLVWDASGGKWWVLDRSASITVVP